MSSTKSMEELVLDLIVNNDPTRENALLELSKKRESFPELAVYLWHSFGTVSVLLQEIVSIYPALNPPALTASASNRVCNALALLQCVASHPETRSLFLKGTSLPFAPTCLAASILHGFPSSDGMSVTCWEIHFIRNYYCCSQRSAFLVPLLEYHKQDQAIRVPTADQPGRDWSVGEGA